MYRGQKLVEYHPKFLHLLTGTWACMYRLSKVEGEFDLIFLDADKHNYLKYLDIILTRRLLSPHGIILVDNGKFVADDSMSLLVPHRDCRTLLKV